VTHALLRERERFSTVGAWSSCARSAASLRDGLDDVDELAASLRPPPGTPRTSVARYTTHPISGKNKIIQISSCARTDGVNDTDDLEITIALPQP